MPRGRRAANPRPSRLAQLSQQDMNQLLAGPSLVLRGSRDSQRGNDSPQTLTCPCCGDTEGHHGTGVIEPPAVAFVPFPSILYVTVPVTGTLWVPVMPPPQMWLPSVQPMPQLEPQPIEQSAQPSARPVMPEQRGQHTRNTMPQPHMPVQTSLGPRRRPDLEGEPWIQVQPASSSSPFPPCRCDAILQSASLLAAVFDRRGSRGIGALSRSGDSAIPRGPGSRQMNHVEMIDAALGELMAATAQVLAAAERLAPPPNPPSVHSSSDADVATYLRGQLSGMTGARRMDALLEISAVLEEF